MEGGTPHQQEVGSQETQDVPAWTYSFSYNYIESTKAKKKVDQHHHKDTEVLDTYLEGIERILTMSELDSYRINDMIDALGATQMVVHDTPPQVSYLSLKYPHPFHIFLLKI